MKTQLDPEKAEADSRHAVDVRGPEAGGWPFGGTPTSYILGNVRAVLPGRIVENARVVVQDGLIAEIDERPALGTGAIDGAGLLCLPGLVDVHSDALEKERIPRPGAVLPWDFAISSFESKLRASGITTVFHGAAFQDKKAADVERTVSAAIELSAHIDEAEETQHGGSSGPSGRIGHRVLHRLDVRSQEGADALAARLSDLPGDGVPVLVSHEDHTPGQGQYLDRRHLENWMVAHEGKSADEARAEVDAVIAAAETTKDILERNLAWLGELARSGAIRLFGHDPDTHDAIDALLERGGAAAEFPTTVEAAERARARGLLITLGAPNVLRGSSHTGNVSGRELIGRGLADALASDYLPTALLGSVFTLANAGIVSLPEAVHLVTAGPAAVAGLEDRGSLEPGQRADLLLVDDARSWPQTVATITV